MNMTVFKVWLNFGSGSSVSCQCSHCHQSHGWALGAWLSVHSLLPLQVFSFNTYKVLYSHKIPYNNQDFIRRLALWMKEGELHIQGSTDVFRFRGSGHSTRYSSLSSSSPWPREQVTRDLCEAAFEHWDNRSHNSACRSQLPLERIVTANTNERVSLQCGSTCAAELQKHMRWLALGWDDHVF